MKTYNFYSRKTFFRLYVALDENEEAEGVLFWDDGETIDTSSQQCLINFQYKNQVGLFWNSCQLWLTLAK